MSPRKPFECDSNAAADIMLLVDGSWSIGRTNFRRVRDFLEGLMTPFHIGPDHIRIGEGQIVLVLVQLFTSSGLIHVYTVPHSVSPVSSVQFMSSFILQITQVQTGLRDIKSRFLFLFLCCTTDYYDIYDTWLC